MSDSRTIKRLHGLGDLVMLLPVLKRISEDGGRLTVLTRPEWAEVFRELAPYAEWTDKALHWALDLDELTAEATCERHRTEEFAWLLGVPRGLPSPRIDVPEGWAPRLELNGHAYCVFAPEAEHEARRPSAPWVAEMWWRMPINRWRVAVRIHTEPPLGISTQFDLRGKTSFRELLGILAGASVVITMDSGVMHLAAAIGAPTVAVFGGVDPRMRLKPEQNVIAFVSGRECWPCNKRETCEDYPCVGDADPRAVAAAVDMAPHVSGLNVIRVSARGEGR